MTQYEILHRMEYKNLRETAKMLGCTVKDVIALADEGKIRIIEKTFSNTRKRREVSITDIRSILNESKDDLSR